MRKIVAMIMMLLPMYAMAAVPEVSAIIKDYSATEGVTVVNLTGDMLKMMAKQGGVSEYTKGIDGLNILTVENDAKIGKKIAKRMKKALKRDKLQSTADIEVEDTIVKAYTKTADSVISDLVVYVAHEGEVAIVLISGEIPESLIGELVKNLK